jgi:hypothetical protein
VGESFFRSELKYPQFGVILTILNVDLGWETPEIARFYLLGKYLIKMLILLEYGINTFH